MTEVYDVAVIGGGSAGLTAASFNGELGRKVVLIEREYIGGDCTWSGCMPSKALLHVAKLAHAVRIAPDYGVAVGSAAVDMQAVRDYVQSVIREVYQHETPEAVAKRGVETITGEARFVDPHMVRVGTRQIQAKTFIIATGGRPAVPPIPGLDKVPFKTNRDFFDNDRLPRHLLIMGAGPIGMEMGQAYRRLGAQVTLIGDQVMPRDDRDAVDVLRRVFADEGITIVEQLVTAAAANGDEITLTLKDGAMVTGDMLLVAVGRTPNVDTLDLERAGVMYSNQGIAVNDHLQTNVPHIYAIGDVTTGPKFTHYAGFQGAVAGRNALLPVGKAKGHDEVVPWVTFTDPEVAHVGMTEQEARVKYGDAVKVHVMLTALGDRTVAEDDMDGFIKLVYRGRGELLGATVVADRAGEMILEYQLVIKTVVSLRTMTSMIHAYPTYSDVARKALARVLVKELLESVAGRLFKRVVRLFG
ncbi:MAG: FAD-dependent oxidoreductase [Chloroflexi bacterium]|nr:FAD-dependent oxidoreductase [Chloroflexota bacterium]